MNAFIHSFIRTILCLSSQGGEGGKYGFAHAHTHTHTHTHTHADRTLPAVRAMMAGPQVFGVQPLGTGLTRDQKVKLLWGTKKQEVEAEPVSGCATYDTNT